ncbi:thioredoxin-like protein 4B isoform X4 [Chlorocebus sabaeus]|uniref:thioredoxin-like protein 4B isoform X4 n=1 Tax=Chlorocebus sabaeus TaxID=60711 RepID=UPI003BF9C6BB
MAAVLPHPSSWLLCAQRKPHWKAVPLGRPHPEARLHCCGSPTSLLLALVCSEEAALEGCASRTFPSRSPPALTPKKPGTSVTHKPAKVFPEISNWARQGSSRSHQSLYLGGFSRCRSPHFELF